MKANERNYERIYESLILFSFLAIANISTAQEDALYRSANVQIMSDSTGFTINPAKRTIYTVVTLNDTIEWITTDDLSYQPTHLMSRPDTICIYRVDSCSHRFVDVSGLNVKYLYLYATELNTTTP